MKKLLPLAIIAMLAFAGCNNDDENTQAAVLSVRLTDAPADYEEVLIEVLEVKINTAADGGEGGWTTMENMNAGIYNLLDFTNGLDTLLAEQELPAGQVSQMRLVLGSNNKVKKSGVYYDLETPSAQQSGLKFNIHANLVDGVTYKLWIDFDAARSIVEKGNGSYSLKPVIRTYTEATSGAIKGTVLPVEAHAVVMAVSAANDTLSTYTDTVSGGFLIGGVAEGIYRLEIKPTDAYSSKTIENINIVLGESYSVDTVQLQVAP